MRHPRLNRSVALIFCYGGLAALAAVARFGLHGGNRLLVWGIVVAPLLLGWVSLSVHLARWLESNPETPFAADELFVVLGRVAMPGGTRLAVTLISHEPGPLDEVRCSDVLRHFPGVREFVQIDPDKIEGECEAPEIEARYFLGELERPRDVSELN